MGIDHGLGGKESAKNKIKRASKAHRNKVLIQSDIKNSSRKNEVVFDEEARKKWLTGFRGRKQTRRKFGLAMQVLKEKKSKQQSKKELRSAVKSNVNPDHEDFVENFTSTGKEILFKDPATSGMFGGEVSVVIDEGIAIELDNYNIPDRVDSQRPHERKKKTLTSLDKAMKAAGDKMQKKYFKQGGKDRLKKRGSTKLLHKAMGAGALGSLGKNAYKGSRKKR